MDDKLKLILNKIGLDEKYFSEFNNSLLEKVVFYKKTDEVKIIIKNQTNFNVELYKELNNCFSNYFSKKVILEVNPVEISFNYIKDYYRMIIEDISCDKVIANLFIDRLVLKDGIYFIEVNNKAEERQLSSFIDDVHNKLKLCGFDIELSTFIDEEESKKTKEEINNALKINVDALKINKTVEKKESTPAINKPKYEKKEVNEDTIKGRVIKDAPVSIKSIVGEEDSVTIDAEVFGVDEFEPASKEFKILTLKLTDYTDSIYAKIFSRDEEEFNNLKKKTKPGSWLRIRGNTKNDKYSGNELVLNIRDINKIESKNVNRKDNAPLKRVELHTHTQMSQMDGICEAKQLVKLARKWGHRAIAITDHDGCQSFPDVYHAVCDINSNLNEGEEPFKAIYGCELTLIDDTVDVVVRPTDTEMLQNTYVVFDFETTGFNAGGGDQIIEVGAVKLLNGEIIDKFSELIDPHRPLPKKITDVTGITDELLQGKDDEEEVIKRFVKWTEDLPMVAHNAKFDVSFLERAYQKYNLGTFTNPVIDTLEISRTMDNTYGRHSLSALVKRYDVPFDEESHHRGDYDAEATALVFHKMMKKLYDRNFEKMTDLDKLVSKDEIYKYGNSYHVNILVKNKVGLKNLFKIISYANTKYFYKGSARILRSVLNEHREGLLIGSGCYESEVFLQARSKADEELTNVVSFYDYVEVQPISCYDHLLQMNDFASRDELIEHIKKIIRITKDSGKIIVATGDVHHINDEDKIYREIIVNQKVPGGGRHPLARNNITSIPSMYFRTTDEMMSAFDFLSNEEKEELVIINPNKIADMIDIIEVIIETGGVPFSPKIDNSVETVTELVYGKASAMYGEVLPRNIEERIAKELYGDAVLTAIKHNLDKEGKLSGSEYEDEAFRQLHEVILKGFDAVYKLVENDIRETKEETLDDKALEKEVKKTLGGVIGGGFDVIYLIAQKLVKKSNDDGYLVGSRGSVGSSFVATMMGITEVNPLPAHYLCRNCKHSIFEIDGKALGSDYSSGYDLPDMTCPVCGSKMGKEGQDMPFATFLGFNADKVPDIDLNFSGDYQWKAHEYTKVLFGVDNVYRAGTIGTVADKTAFGFVKGYCEDKGIDNMRTAEVERIAIGCTGIKRTTGQHPGGIVVIPGYMDVYDFTPYQFPAGDTESLWRTTHFDYHAIDQDVLKLDILGHDDPTILRMLQDLSGIDVTTLPMDDKKVISLLSSPDALGVTEEQIMCPTGTLGLPELGTKFVINMLVETKPKTFAELVKISGLSHGTDVWAGNASELIRNKVVEFKEVIGCRDDIMVYLMYNGLKPIDAFKIMEFVRKGKASKDPEGWVKWEAKMREANIPDWYIDSCRKIKYMFPKAHACAYVMSAIRIAWFKVYKPIYYYAAYFSIRSDDFDIETMIKGYDAIKSKMEDIKLKGYDATNKEANILTTLEIALEATARGIKFANVDLYKSMSRDFVVGDDGMTLIPSFRTIDGLGDTVSNAIVEERAKKEFISIEDLQKRCKVSLTITDKMRSMGILNGMPESSQMSLNLF